MGYGYYMNDPRFWRGVIDVLDASWKATEKRFEKYNKLNEDIMKEKMTKKMTKAEAFEYLKGKKVRVYGQEMNDEVQSKLFACGVEWKHHGTDVRYYCDYLVINPEGFVCHCDGMGEDYWNRLFHEEISADDILSLDIEEEYAKDDEDPYFGGRIKDLQEMIGDDEVLIITKTNFKTMTK